MQAAQIIIIITLCKVVDRITHLFTARKQPVVHAASSHGFGGEWEVTEAHDLPGQVCGEALVHAAMHTSALWVLTQQVTLNLQHERQDKLS